jgi:N-acetyl-anhydromuramyl-L-alanine amidase AmpD
MLMFINARIFKMGLISILRGLRKGVNSINKEKEILKKYPEAIVLKDEPIMSRGGTYKNKFPEGAIVHFTAGWQTQKGKDAVSFANKNGHRYFFIDEHGQVFQQFCLTGYGPHAGVSKCPVTKRTTVSQYYVGIEVACGGRLEDADKDGQVDDTYFKNNVHPMNIRTGSISEKWQKSSYGSYEKFTLAQEISLKKLLEWLCKEGMNPELIFGHDEVAPERKNDPGLSLSTSMEEFRKEIKRRLQ